MSDEEGKELKTLKRVTRLWEQIDAVVNDKREKFLSKIAEKAEFAHTPLTVPKGICVKCGRDASKFKDEVSIKEYLITKFCQKCQDEYYA